MSKYVRMPRHLFSRKCGKHKVVIDELKSIIAMLQASKEVEKYFPQEIFNKKHHVRSISIDYVPGGLEVKVHGSKQIQKVFVKTKHPKAVKTGIEAVWAKRKY